MVSLLAIDTRIKLVLFLLINFMVFGLKDFVLGSVCFSFICIPHFYEGEMSGAVLIDGVDTRTIQPHDLSDKIGSVFQNPRSQFFSLDTDSEIVFGMENKGIRRMSRRSAFAMAGIM